MKHLKMWGLVSLMTAIGMLAGAGTASAAIIESGSGTQYKAGTQISAASEGTTEFHTVFGSINCNSFSLAGTTTNDGSPGTNVNVAISSLAWSGCNAIVVVLANGSLSIEPLSGGNAAIYSTGTEVTIEYLGFHCIFKTNNTKIGTLTGGTPATLDIQAQIPRTGGRSGLFCGSSGVLTGSLAVSNPSSLVTT
ncbi:MAG TPA: hypothetical protein VFO36_13885 [Nitrospiraceae bacterium]|nr:hypothetical protein [Nitrospiraceae bacterium]